MTSQDLNLLSMEELSRLAHNEGEDEGLRLSALQILNRREKQFFSKHCNYGSQSKNYVPDL